MFFSVSETINTKNKMSKFTTYAIEAITPNGTKTIFGHTQRNTKSVLVKAIYNDLPADFRKAMLDATPENENPIIAKAGTWFMKNAAGFIVKIGDAV